MSLDNFRQAVESPKSWNSMGRICQKCISSAKKLYTEDLSNITFNYLCDNLPNSLCHFWNHKSFSPKQLLYINLTQSLHTLDENISQTPRHFRRWGGLCAHTRKKKKLVNSHWLKSNLKQCIGQSIQLEIRWFTWLFNKLDILQLERTSRNNHQQLASQIKVGLQPFIGSACRGSPPATNGAQTTQTLVGDILFH